MRALRSLTLLLAMIAPSAFAAEYQVEIILVRQNAVPAITSQFAPEDWRQGAQAPSGDATRPPALSEQAAKLTADSQYTVLLHKAWRQEIGSEATRVAVNDGEEQFGHFPIEGNLKLSQGRFVAVEANLWLNQLDSNGNVLQSEQFKQSNANVKNGELTFMDGGHLALLLKVTARGTRTLVLPDPESMEQ